MKEQRAHIRDLKPDERNPRRHTPRNLGMIERSLQEVGAGRSVVIDEENNLIVGNGTIEAAASAGIERVRIIDAEPDEIVAVRRRGMTDEQKVKMKLYDNRAGELAEWEEEVVVDYEEEGIDLSGVFTSDELDEIRPDHADPDAMAAVPVETRTIGYYRRVHVLVSFAPDRMLDLLPLIEQLRTKRPAAVRPAGIRAAKVDNSRLDWKVAMRCAMLPASDPVKVLDCFGGDGHIWSNVLRLHPERDIRVLRIEQKAGKRGTYLRGDNVKFLTSPELDINRFDVIDLDAYGVPYEQLRAIFERGFRGVVHVTATLIAQGKPPYAMLEELGYPRSMIEKCPSLFGGGRKALERICEYLALNGVRSIRIATAHEGSQKHYMSFRTTESPSVPQPK
jgi:hypothetical protein